jgi:hypothetical protein
MRIILTVAIILTSSINMIAQSDYLSLDRQTFDQYLRGDYKNLKITTTKMLVQGIDFYYLRMRIGILSYNNQRYPNAVEHFTKAIEFNSWDTISREYIYYSYLFSGRKADANIYLSSITPGKKNYALKRIKEQGLSDIFILSSYNSYDAKNYTTNSLYYEAVDKSLIANVGMENYFSSKFKGNFVYTFYNKSGKIYSSFNPEGKELDFTQNQLYAKFTGLTFPGWEFSGFGHFAIFSDVLKSTQSYGRKSSIKLTTEYLGGVSISKNGWRVRGGINLSYSNFGKSSQLRGEGYFVYLPFGNLNLYLTSGGMYQTDQNWGDTYQVNQEVGLKIFDHLWVETGVIMGNSFLYARNQGLNLNNSFQIPSTTFYGNFIAILGNRLSLTLSPYYTENQIYSWDLNALTKTNKLVLNSYGGNIKLTFKIK